MKKALLEKPMVFVAIEEKSKTRLSPMISAALTMAVRNRWQVEGVIAQIDW
jgi:hypothetical protein